MSAFHSVVSAGGLVSLQKLMFQGNPARAVLQKSVLETLRERVMGDGKAE